MRNRTSSTEAPTELKPKIRCKWRQLYPSHALLACYSVYDALNDNYDRFEAWLGQFIDVLDVDIMPGKEDFSSAYFP